MEKTPRNLLYALSNEYEGDIVKMVDAIHRRDESPFDKYEDMPEPTDSFMTIMDDDYPESLKVVTAPPMLLYTEGRKELMTDGRKKIAVINADEKTNADMMTEILDELSDVILVVDINNPLIDEIAETGHDMIVVSDAGIKASGGESNGRLTISEYPHHIKGNPKNRIVMQRIVAGLCDVMMVVSVDQKKSMIAVKYALEQGKDIYVIPAMDKALYNNEMIKEGAFLLDCAEDMKTKEE